MQEIIQYNSLSNQAYDILKRRIIERQLVPNTKLDINEISRQLGVSRMPVVDALARLEGEGLVERRNRVGTFVTALDQAFFDEMFEARLMIEMWAAALIAERMTAADQGTLRTLLSEASLLLQVTTDSSFDYLSSVRYDTEFHLGLIRLCGNSRVIDIYESLNVHAQVARVYSLRALQRAREGQQEHEAILAAFAAGNVEQAQSRQRLHVERSRAGLRVLLDRHGEL